MKISPLFWPVLVGAATLGWSLSLESQPKAQAQPAARPSDAFTPVSRLLGESNLEGAAALLKKMKADGLAPDQISRWETLAARVAVRLGDRVWLHEINEGGSLSTGADELVTLSAMRLIFANRLDEARLTLESIKDPYGMSEIPKRRYEELYLKLEQLSGDKKAEAKWAGKLVDFVSKWDSPTCQSCHANPKAHGEEITQFDLNGWWVGKRFSQLVGESGAAPQVEKEARATLLRNPNDEAALIRLGYALRAQKREVESEKSLRAVSWSQWSDKPFKKPLRLGQFP